MTTCSHDGKWSKRSFIGIGCGLFGAMALSRATATTAAATEKIAQPAKPGGQAYIARAFEMRDLAVSSGDQGYGALIVSKASGLIVGQAPSRVVTNTDPSAHAEMEAIRDASRRLGARDLSNHVMYSSSRPCAMCEAAAYWANLDGMFFGRSGTDAGPPRLCG